MRLAYPLRLAALAATLTVVGCGGKDNEAATDTAVPSPSAGATGSAGTMPMDTARVDTTRRDSATATGTGTGTSTRP